MYLFYFRMRTPTPPPPLDDQSAAAEGGDSEGEIVRDTYKMPPPLPIPVGDKCTLRVPSPVPQPKDINVSEVRTAVTTLFNLLLLILLNIMFLHRWEDFS